MHHRLMYTSASANAYLRYGNSGTPDWACTDCDSADRVFRPRIRFSSWWRSCVATWNPFLDANHHREWLPHLLSAPSSVSVWRMSSVVTWSACSGIFATFLAVSWTALFIELRRRIGAGQYYKSAITVVSAVGHVIAVTLLVLNTLDIAWQPTFAPYLACLMLYFFWGSNMFIRIIYVSLSESR